MTEPAPHAETPGPRVSETRARQGFRDRPILIVLAVSLALAVAALLGLWTMRQGDLRTTNADVGQDRRDAEAFSQEPQPPKGD